MRTCTRLLIPWMLLIWTPSIGTGCGFGGVLFGGTGTESDGGPDGAGGTTSGGASGTSGSSGTAGEGGTNGSAGGAAGSSGTSGRAGAGGASGASGRGGAAGSSGASSTGGAAGTSSSGGAAGNSGGGGVSGNSGASGASGSGGAAGSSGASGTGGAGNSGASGTAGASGNAGNSGAAGSGIDASTDGDADTTDVRSEDTVATDRSRDAGCPDVLGTYEINNADGCGDVDENAPQEIRGAPPPCFLNFISIVDAGTGAINGSATLDPDGTFSGDTLTLGTNVRNNCSGSWNEMEQEITVVCGNGMNECLIELRRTDP